MPHLLFDYKPSSQGHPSSHVSLISAVDLPPQQVGFNSSDPAIAFPKPLPFSGLDPATPGGYPPLDACLAHGFFEYYMSFASEAMWHAINSQPEMQQVGFLFPISN